MHQGSLEYKSSSGSCLATMDFQLKWRQHTKAEGTGGEYRDASGDSLFWTLHLDYTLLVCRCYYLGQRERRPNNHNKYYKKIDF